MPFVFDHPANERDIKITKKSDQGVTTKENIYNIKCKQNQGSLPIKETYYIGNGPLETSFKRQNYLLFMKSKDKFGINEKINALPITSFIDVRANPILA